MKIFRNFEDSGSIINPVVTTGSFDGVHIGHKAILNRLKLLAEKHNGESTLITFDPHPRKVLYPETAGKDLKLINSQEEKLELLERAGLDNVIIIEFTREFSRISSEQFVRDYLCRQLKAKVVVVGFNHHFGFNKEGDYRQLWGWQKEYKFEAEEIPEQEVSHETVSSTKIRDAISDGYIQRANAYLDHYYIIIGEAEDYSIPARNDIPDFKRIILTEECKLLPPPDIYAVSVEADKACSKGMLIVNSQSSGYPLVMLDIFESASFSKGNRIMISFHKKIQGKVDVSDSNFLSRMNLAKNEISDLIF